MKRFKNCIHGSLWAVIFGLGLYVLVKGVSIAGGGKNLTRKTAQLYAPVFTLAPVKGTENQSWLSLLTKEVVPLLTYWESKESYFLSEEPQLTVREETEKNPESEKTQETQKSSEVQNTQDQMPQKAEAESMEEPEKTVIQKAVKKKKRKKNKKAQTEETKEQQETVNMEELQDFQTLVGNYYTVDASTTADPEQINAEKLAFLTDIEGVYKDYNDKSSLISELSTTEARELLAGGTIGGGMLPKLNNCIDAIEHGVSRVHILDGRIPHCLLLEIFTNKGVGTAILSEGAEKFFDTNI